MEKSRNSIVEVSMDKMDIHEDEKKIPIKSGPYILLKISDNGPVMEMTVLSRIFDFFLRQKVRGRELGSGFLLFTESSRPMKNILTYDQNRVRETALIYLPVYQRNLKLEEKAPEKLNLQKGDENILFLDDDEKVASMVGRILLKLGYKAKIFLHSKKALEKFEKGPNDYDLVITDLTMPEMTGVRFARKINDIRPDILVILCAGFGESLDKKEIDSTAIQGLLDKLISVKKPFRSPSGIT
jgi:CheY-like chemotaxis protein